MKDISELKNLAADIITKAKLQGASSVDVGISMHVGLSVNVRLGKVDTISFNRDKAIGITVYKGQRKAVVTSSDLSSKAIDMAIIKACNIADFTEEDPCSGLPDRQDIATTAVDLNLYHPQDFTAEQAITIALECEQAALDCDKKINNSDGANFSFSSGQRVYGNSLGFIAGYPSSKFHLSCTPIAEENGKKQRDYDYSIVRDYQDLATAKKIGQSAASKTLARLGAAPIATCRAKVLLRADVARGLLGKLVAAISGGNLYRKASFLVGCLHQPVFPDFINVTEQPYVPKAIGSASFDLEGVATAEKSIITDGILSSYLLNSYSARKLDMHTTGNCGGVHNLKLAASAGDLAAMINKMHTGLLVTELMGHGVNLINGDYSQGAGGLWIENGQIKHAVEEVTIAGNLRDMFRNMIAAGDDYDQRSSIITGSILLDDMTIAGK